MRTTSFPIPEDTGAPQQEITQFIERSTGLLVPQGTFPAPDPFPHWVDMGIDYTWADMLSVAAGGWVSMPPPHSPPILRLAWVLDMSIARKEANILPQGGECPYSKKKFLG